MVTTSTSSIVTCKSLDHYHSWNIQSNKRSQACDKIDAQHLWQGYIIPASFHGQLLYSVYVNAGVHMWVWAFIHSQVYAGQTTSLLPFLKHQLSSLAPQHEHHLDLFKCGFCKEQIAWIIFTYRNFWISNPTKVKTSKKTFKIYIASRKNTE